MKIVLIGYRGCGKSTLGRELSANLGWPLLDIDRGIEQKRPGKTLTDLWLDIGDDAFRDIEAAVVREMCRLDECVISFGAGSLGRPQNRTHACRDALVVYLNMTAKALWERIQSDPRSATTRPNLAGGGFEEVVQMMEKRDPVYRQCANLRVDATRSPEHLAGVVIAHMRKPD
jgi:shikimate kinase